MPPADAGARMVEEWRATVPGDDRVEPVSVPGSPAAFAGCDTVEYATTFDDPRDADDDAAVLVLRGLYAHADVELSADRLDGDGAVEHDCYFAPLRVPFDPGETNDLVVTCRSPDDRFGGLHDTDLVPESDRVPGVWWDASLETHPLPYVDDTEVRPEITGEGARLHVRTTVVTGGPLEDRITYSLRPEGDHAGRGTMERSTVRTEEAGPATVEHTIEIRGPSLWWPRELGDQHRYRLTAKLGDSERSVAVGVCDVGFADGRLVVNGEPLPVRGVNLLTADTEDVRRAREVNANLVRAHAHVLPEEVYEACDEAGLLVWQDLPLTGPGEFDTDRGRALARTLSRTRGRHPSLAAHAVHDDPTTTFEDGLGSGLLDRLRLRVRAWRTGYDPVPAETVADALPDHAPVFPVVGGPGVGADAAAYYPGWDYGEPADIDALLDRYPADVVAEFGAGAVADGDSDAAGFDRAKHDRHVDGGVDASQRYQAGTLRTVAERLRRRETGAVAFALRDTGAGGMGVFASDGTPKRAKTVLGRAFAPVQAFLAAPSPGGSDVVVVNDSPGELSATLEWSAGDRGGAFDLTVGPRDRWTGGPVTVPRDCETVELELDVGGRRVGNAYDLS